MNLLGMQTSVTSRLDDTELVARVLDGDPFAFEAIMRRHNRLLFRTAYGILRNHAETEDALQEAYVSAWRSLHTFRGSAKLSTWLARIVLNESLGRARRRHPQLISLDIALDSTEAHAQEWLEDDPNTRPEQLAMRSEFRQLVRRKIDSLPQAFRTVFVLRGIEERSVAEVALALDVPRATVRSRYFRARSLLRESLSQEPHFGMENVPSFDGCAPQKGGPPEYRSSGGSTHSLRATPLPAAITRMRKRNHRPGRRPAKAAAHVRATPQAMVRRFPADPRVKS